MSAGGVAQPVAVARPAESRLTLPQGRGELAVRSWHVDAAPADAAPVLAVHGWLDNAASFDPLAPLLPGRPLHAIDLPGHGLSDHRPAGMRYHNMDYLDDLLAVLDRYAPERPAILLGHSLGAGLWMLLAGMFPERVSRLILLDGLGPFPADPEQFASQTRDTLAGFRGFSGAQRPIADEAQAVRARMNGMTGPLSEAAARLLCTRGLVRTATGELVWRADKRLRLNSLMRFDERQILSCIRAITAPVLLVRASDGPPVPAGGYEERARHFRDLRMARLPGGHHLHMDGGEAAVAELIREFLAEA